MKLRRVNHILLALIIVLNLYTLFAPLIPAISFWSQTRTGKTRHSLQAEIKLSKRPPAGTTAVAVHPAPQGNRVIIPAMLLDQPIFDGPVYEQYKILNNGIWRYSLGSTPDKGGNTILIGHRFTYTNPRGVFYFTNKLQLGDEIGLHWNNVEYLYKVNSITVVPPTDTSIEAPTADARLTLFTCTPLWIPKNRLVVTATLEGHS